MQRRQDNLFSKIDGNSDGGIDKSEFSDFAKKLSEKTGKSLNVDDVYSKYDKDGNGSLSKDELKAFMKDNAPPPPDQMQNARSAYGTNSGTDQVSAFLESLQSQLADSGSSSTNDSGSLSDYLSKLLESIKSGTSSSVLSVTA
jgi:Ca2+-binding EF-hand superfamily protein